MARFKEAAPALLQRLLAAAVVNAAAGSMEFKGGAWCLRSCNNRAAQVFKTLLHLMRMLGVALPAFN